MARSREQFICKECGAQHNIWQGQCSDCKAWNTLKAVVVTPKVDTQSSRAAMSESAAQAVMLSEVEIQQEYRFQVGISELDRVLGGGLVPGSVVLIGGDPGIGKSTLLMEGVAALAGQGIGVLYVSGEESLRQLKLRSERLGVSGEGLLVQAENRIDAVAKAVQVHQPRVLVLDSIQTLYTEEHASAAGTVTQVRECAARVISMAKQRHMAVFLVGHVTKGGQIAGPKVLEHMVDTVLYFEGERGHDYRILRAVKNRFGSANEIGVFEMRESGLKEVSNPSELFLSERVAGASGSVVFAGIEGTRPVLVEIQSLVAPSPLSQPRRTTLGFDTNRLAMLTAVLEKRLGLGLFNHDIFLNVAGGYRIQEPAADLAVVLSLFASHRNLGVDANTIILGEVGLAGEIRSVAHVESRLREAAKLGFSRCLLAAKNRKHIPDALSLSTELVTSVEEAVECISR
ncbi:MAG: DNA repair protein RadA [Magnetococcales bacterium]|nr:DNA repair protein RadA [Magnetococcales bacterium]